MSFDPEGLGRAIAAQGSVVRVVVAEVQGSAPRDPGASMLVWNGGQDGTIGGGALEFEAARVAREMLAGGAARRFVRAILGPDIGQCCGGTVGLFYELFTAVPEVAATFARAVSTTPQREPPAHMTGPGFHDGWFIEPVGTPGIPVWIWGAGHVGRALARALARQPGLAVTLIDTAAERLPAPLPDGVTARIAPEVAGEIAGAVEGAPSDAHHFVLTYSHDLDFALCDALLPHGFASLGLIGSATKWARFRSRLAQKGHASEAIVRIHCPIGNPALGKHPEAIALGAAHALLVNLAETEADSPVAG